MKYIFKILSYIMGRPLNRYEQDEVEIVVNEFLSILIVSSIVVCVVYILMGI